MKIKNETLKKLTNDELVDTLFEEAMAKRQECKSLIDEIMEGVDDDDEDDGY